MNIEIYPCGTRVLLSQHNVTAEITAITIRFTAIIYELTYFINNEERTVSAHEQQFRPVHNTTKVEYVYATII